VAFVCVAHLDLLRDVPRPRDVVRRIDPRPAGSEHPVLVVLAVVLPPQRQLPHVREALRLPPRLARLGQRRQQQRHQQRNDGNHPKHPNNIKSPSALAKGTNHGAPPEKADKGPLPIHHFSPSLYCRRFSFQPFSLFLANAVSARPPVPYHFPANLRSTPTLPA